MKTKSFRLSMIAVVISMGMVCGMIVFLSSQAYSTLVFENVRTSLSELVQLKVYDLLKAYTLNTEKLGASLQINPKLRQYIKENNTENITKILNEQYHQYFVTAGVVKLHSIIIFDRQFEIIAQSSNQDTAKPDIFAATHSIPCQSVVNRVSKRQGPERLKPYSGLCRVASTASYATLVPVGSFSPIAYVMVITDPVAAMIGTEAGLGMPIRITDTGDNAVYESPRWPKNSDLQDFVKNKYLLRDEDGNVVSAIEIVRNIGGFQQKWQSKFFTILVLTVLSIVLALVVCLYILHRGFKPLGKLHAAAEKLSDGVFEHISDTSFTEIDIPIQSFNKMAEKIVDLIDNLESEIGDRKNAEAELRDHHNHLEELVKERTEDLAGARDIALKASKAKSSFLANMSHELRTPLNAIIGYSELMQDDIKDGELGNITSDLDKISHSGKHLLILIGEILDLSKIEAGRMVMENIKFNIETFITETILTVSPQIQQHDNQLELNLEKNLGSIITDQKKLRQTLINLLGNASKFTQKGVITLDVKWENTQDKHFLLIVVHDTGIGVSLENKRNLFDDFTQADSSTTRLYGGTGLGLSISSRFCELMGGALTYESEVNVGSVFTIRIPHVVVESCIEIDPKKLATG